MNKYNDFLLDREFESITNQIFRLVENGGQFTSDNTYVWDMSKKQDDEKPVTFEWDFTKTNDSIIDKLENLLKKLPKEKIQEYFFRFIDKIKLLPEKFRRKILVNYATAFLSVASVAFLISGMNHHKTDEKVVKEFVKVTKKASFEVSHKKVATIEGGYSDDRSDRGNYVEFELNGKMVKRFIGTKYGISAPVLMKYLGHLPKKEDMMNLSYETALDIYKDKYWDDQGMEKFCNQSVATIIYDGCVNQGIGGMKDILRKVLNDNGVQISEDTTPFQTDYIKVINSLDQAQVFDTIKKYRKDRYHNTATAKEHEGGWINRLEKLEFVD
jgi:lysozyme family protein